MSKFTTSKYIIYRSDISFITKRNKKIHSIPRLPIIKLITIRQVICQTKLKIMSQKQPPPPTQKLMTSKKASSVNISLSTFLFVMLIAAVSQAITHNMETECSFPCTQQLINCYNPQLYYYSTRAPILLRHDLF